MAAVQSRLSRERQERSGATDRMTAGGGVRRGPGNPLRSIGRIFRHARDGRAMRPAVIGSALTRRDEPVGFRRVAGTWRWSRLGTEGNEGNEELGEW
jgi:hypothetical protein